MERMWLPARVSQPGGGGSDLHTHPFAFSQVFVGAFCICFNRKLCSGLWGHSHQSGMVPVFLEPTFRGGEFGDRQVTK